MNHFQIFIQKIRLRIVNNELHIADIKYIMQKIVRSIIKVDRNFEKAEYEILNMEIIILIIDMKMIKYELKFQKIN